MLYIVRMDNEPKENEGPLAHAMTLAITRDNIAREIINYLGFDDPVSNATNDGIKAIVDKNFKKIGVTSS